MGSIANFYTRAIISYVHDHAIIQAKMSMKCFSNAVPGCTSGVPTIKADDTAVEETKKALAEIGSHPPKRLKRSNEDNFERFDSQATLVLGSEDHLDGTPRYEAAEGSAGERLEGGDEVKPNHPREKKAKKDKKEKRKKEKKENKETRTGNVDRPTKVNAAVSEDDGEWDGEELLPRTLDFENMELDIESDAPEDLEAIQSDLCETVDDTLVDDSLADEMGEPNGQSVEEIKKMLYRELEETNKKDQSMEKREEYKKRLAKQIDEDEQKAKVKKEEAAKREKELIEKELRDDETREKSKDKSRKGARQALENLKAQLAKEKEIRAKADKEAEEKETQAMLAKEKEIRAKADKEVEEKETQAMLAKEKEIRAKADKEAEEKETQAMLAKEKEIKEKANKEAEEKENRTQRPVATPQAAAKQAPARPGLSRGSSSFEAVADILNRKDSQQQLSPAPSPPATVGTHSNSTAPASTALALLDSSTKTPTSAASEVLNGHSDEDERPKKRQRTPAQLIIHKQKMSFYRSLDSRMLRQELSIWHGWYHVHVLCHSILCELKNISCYTMRVFNQPRFQIKFYILYYPIIAWDDRYYLWDPKVIYPTCPSVSS